MQAVIGSRTISAFDFSRLPLSDVISGGAEGIDQAVKRYCDQNNIPIIEIKPDYAKHGSYAPLVRNREIVDKASEIYAIWDGRSTGTKMVINYAEKQGKKVFVIRVNPDKPKPEFKAKGL